MSCHSKHRDCPAERAHGGRDVARARADWDGYRERWRGEWIQYRILRDQWNPQIEFEITATFGLPDVTPENVGEHFARVRRACEEQGRDLTTLRMFVVLVGVWKDEG